MSDLAYESVETFYTKTAMKLYRKCRERGITLEADHLLFEALLTQVVEQYRFFLEVGIANSIIADAGHRRSFKVVREEIQKLGEFAKSDSNFCWLMQSARNYLIKGVFENAEEAYHRYCEARDQVAQRLSESNSELSQQLRLMVNIVVYRIWSKKFNSIEEVEDHFSELWQIAKSRLGDQITVNTKTGIVSISINQEDLEFFARAVFRMNLSSMGEAIKRYKKLWQQVFEKHADLSLEQKRQLVKNAFAMSQEII